MSKRYRVKNQPWIISLQKTNGNSPPENGYDFPDATDGIAGFAFIETAVQSSSSEEKWLKFPEL